MDLPLLRSSNIFSTLQIPPTTMSSLSLLSRPPFSSSLHRSQLYYTSHRHHNVVVTTTITTTRLPSTAPRHLTIKAFSALSPVQPLTQDDLKKLAADKAVEYVKSGMVLGLGTGSTAAFVVSKIRELLAAGYLKDIVGVPTSKRTQEQAASLGIPLSVLDDHPKLDLAIDDADEVDPDLNLVKGRGGALLREKMVEAALDKFVVVVDDSKLVSGLGGSGLAMPMEVVQSVDAKKQTVFILQTADIWSTSSAADICRCGPQAADIFLQKKQTAPK